MRGMALTGRIAMRVLNNESTIRGRARGRRDARLVSKSIQLQRRQHICVSD